MVQRDDIDSLFNEEEFSVDLDNEAVLKEKQARSEVCSVQDQPVSQIFLSWYPKVKVKGKA